MADIHYDDIVKNIKDIIVAKGLKQAAVAKKANLTEKELSDMLNCRRKLIRAEHLPAIANALEVDVNELFRVGQEVKKMLSDNELKKKEEVTIAVGDWIVREIKNTSSLETESILLEIIKAFFNYCAD